MSKDKISQNTQEISKVKLANGDVYDFKDQYVREQLEILLGTREADSTEIDIKNK